MALKSRLGQLLPNFSLSILRPPRVRILLQYAGNFALSTIFYVLELINADTLCIRR